MHRSRPDPVRLRCGRSILTVPVLTLALPPYSSFGPWRPRSTSGWWSIRSHRVRLQFSGGRSARIGLSEPENSTDGNPKDGMTKRPLPAESGRCLRNTMNWNPRAGPQKRVFGIRNRTLNPVNAANLITLSKENRLLPWSDPMTRPMSFPDPKTSPKRAPGISCLNAISQRRAGGTCRTRRFGNPAAVLTRLFSGSEIAFLATY